MNVYLYHLIPILTTDFLTAAMIWFIEILLIQFNFLATIFFTPRGKKVKKLKKLVGTLAVQFLDNASV